MATYTSAGFINPIGLQRAQAASLQELANTYGQDGQQTAQPPPGTAFNNAGISGALQSVAPTGATLNRNSGRRGMKYGGADEPMDVVTSDNDRMDALLRDIYGDNNVEMREQQRNEIEREQARQNARERIAEYMQETEQSIKDTVRLANSANETLQEKAKLAKQTVENLKGAHTSYVGSKHNAPYEVFIENPRFVRFLDDFVNNPEFYGTDAKTTVDHAEAQRIWHMRQRKGILWVNEARRRKTNRNSDLANTGIGTHFISADPKNMTGAGHHSMYGAHIRANDNRFNTNVSQLVTDAQLQTAQRNFDHGLNDFQEQEVLNKRWRIGEFDPTIDFQLEPWRAARRQVNAMLIKQGYDPPQRVTAAVRDRLMRREYARNVQRKIQKLGARGAIITKYDDSTVNNVARSGAE